MEGKKAHSSKADMKTITNLGAALQVPMCMSYRNPL